MPGMYHPPTIKQKAGTNTSSMINTNLIMLNECTTKVTTYPYTWEGAGYCGKTGKG